MLSLAKHLAIASRTRFFALLRMTFLGGAGFRIGSKLSRRCCHGIAARPHEVLASPIPSSHTLLPTPLPSTNHPPSTINHVAVEPSRRRKLAHDKPDEQECQCARRSDRHWAPCCHALPSLQNGLTDPQRALPRLGESNAAGSRPQCAANPLTDSQPTHVSALPIRLLTY